MSWHVVSESEGETTEFPWGAITWLASGALGTCPALTFGKVVIRPGERNPGHRHTNCWELLYLLEGRLRHHFGGEWAEMGAGELAVVPPGLAHWAEATGDEPAVMLVVYSAGERRMEEL